VILTLGIILTTPLMANAGDDPAGEIRQGALSAADGDTSRAFFLLSTRTADLLDKTNVLQRDIQIINSVNERYKEYYGFDNKSWARSAWDSDAVKVVIFIGGIWLGTRIVENVN
jgi:hypothetical protein